jgi:hypothetical protein
MNIIINLINIIMSSLDEAFMPILQNMNGVCKSISTNEKEFYAKLFADYIYNYFSKKNDLYKKNKTNNLKLLKNDYDNYVKKVWKGFKISESFLSLFIIELRKYGLKYLYNEHEPASIIEGPAHYFKISNNYEEKIFIITPSTTPIYDYNDIMSKMN